MARKLRPKRRRRYTGKAVRLSNAVIDALTRKCQGARSYDAIVRKLLGMPDWQGNPPGLIEGCVEVTTGRFFPRSEGWEKAEQDAYELAIKEAVRAKTKKVNKPVKVREIP